jgi:hypothetical protein
MRRLHPALFTAFLAASPLLGGSAHDCLDLSARIDNDVHSPSGIRVFVTGRNHCGEDIDGRHGSFQVKALGSGNSVIGSQHGRFGGTVAANGSVETMVFVVCDPDRVRSVSVSAD